MSSLPCAVSIGYALKVNWNRKNKTQIRSLLVSVNDSPAHAKSLRNDTIGIRQQIKSIAKTLAENHRKWEAAHRRGIVLCTAIEKCKTHAIESFSNENTDPTGRTLYPDDLKTLCDKLQIITTIFEDVRNSAADSRCQIDLFVKLGAANVFSESRTVFKTWTCEMVQNVVADICSSYDAEFKNKVNVMENIAHSKRPEDIVLHLCVWEFQLHVDTHIDFLMKELITEADVEMKKRS